MLADAFRALIFAALPVGVCSYLLAWFALRRGYVAAGGTVGRFEKDVKLLSKSRKKQKSGKGKKQVQQPPVKLNPVHNKWLSFGGGFYGVMALLTYIVIEGGEIRDFISNLGGLLSFIPNLSVDVIVRLIIDSFMNFLMALIWPLYWNDHVIHGDFWTWLIAAYLGYWLGTRYALHRAGGVEAP